MAFPLRPLMNMPELNAARIISPMEKGLPLPPAARAVTSPACLFQLRDVSPNSAPPFDLSLIIQATPAEIVAAIPLEPSPRIFRINPAFGSPNRERLRGINPKIV